MGCCAVLLCFPFLLVVAALERVLLKRMVDEFHNYGYFVSQLSTLCFFAFIGSVAVARNLCFRPFGRETTSFPKRLFLLIALFDAVAGILTIVSASNVPGNTMVVVFQSVLPFTFLGSALFLNKRFQVTHYMGCVLLVAAVLLSVLPKFWEKSETVSWYALLLILANIPAALSGISQEICFERKHIDVYYVQAWVALFQFCLGIPFAPFGFWLQKPAFSNINDLVNNLEGGFRCLATYDTAEGDNCAYAPVFFVAYLIVNIIFNITLSYTCRFAGVLTMQVAVSVAVPVTCLLFSAPIAGLIPDPVPLLDYFNIGGLVCVIVGLALYHFPEKPVAGDPVDSKDEDQIAAFRESLLDHMDESDGGTGMASRRRSLSGGSRIDLRYPTSAYIPGLKVGQGSPLGGSFVSAFRVESAASSCKIGNYVPLESPVVYTPPIPHGVASRTESMGTVGSPKAELSDDGSDAGDGLLFGEEFQQAQGDGGAAGGGKKKSKKKGKKSKKKAKEPVDIAGNEV